MRRLDTVFRNIRSFQFDIDLPNVPSNGTVSQDVVTTESFPLGTHVISWGVSSDATSIEDLIVTFLFVDVDTLRVTIINPTGGAVDPANITFNFVTGEFNADLDIPE